MEHQEDASHCKNDEEETRNSPQAERIGEFEAMAFDLSRENMEEEVVINQHGPLQIRIGHSSSEDRTPHCRIQNALYNAFLHIV
jgi:hypothetical protein